MKQRQVIVTWYTPEEQLPPDCEKVVVTFSGSDQYITYDHALGLADWADDGGGWMIDNMTDKAEFIIHAWCDLEPYGLEEKMNFEINPEFARERMTPIEARKLINLVEKLSKGLVFTQGEIVDILKICDKALTRYEQEFPGC